MNDSKTPFRDPAESPTSIALARFRTREVHPIRAACAMIGRYRQTEKASPRARDVASADTLGFERLGSAAEGLFPVFRKRIYVDAPRTTQIHLSSLDYFFVTYFESGKCVITWDHAPQTPSSDVLMSRNTAGSFDADYAAHTAEVRKRADTDTPIAVRDLADAVALGDFYYRGVVPVGLALSTVVAVAFPFAFFAMVAVWWLSRLLR